MKYDQIHLPIQDMVLLSAVLGTPPRIRRRKVTGDFDGPVSIWEHRQFVNACIDPSRGQGFVQADALVRPSSSLPDLVRAESILHASCHPDIRVIPDDNQQEDGRSTSSTSSISSIGATL